MTGPMGFALCVCAGFLAWSFVEYGIHGLLSHRFRTFVSPMHWGHHEMPAAVFTAPVAWVPIVGLLTGLGLLLFPAPLVMGGVLGLLCGFARYEWMHWRIHFRAPRNPREEQLRRHHLAHHFINPRTYHGVTTHFWDGVFGTLPVARNDDYARVAGIAPLPGPSNFLSIWHPRFAVAHARAAIAQARGANPRPD